MRWKSLVLGACLWLAAAAGWPAQDALARTFDAFPDETAAPRISVDLVKKIMESKKQVVLVYTGYRVPELFCGSFLLPYTEVPPAGSGDRVTFNVPKDTYIFAY